MILNDLMISLTDCREYSRDLTNMSSKSMSRLRCEMVVESRRVGEEGGTAGRRNGPLSTHYDCGSTLQIALTIKRQQ